MRTIVAAFMAALILFNSLVFAFEIQPVATAGLFVAAQSRFELVIQRVRELDSVESIIGQDGADWKWQVQFFNGTHWLPWTTEVYAGPNRPDANRLNCSYSWIFDTPSNRIVRFRIMLLDDDTWEIPDLVDISSEAGEGIKDWDGNLAYGYFAGAIFEGAYNLETGSFTGDSNQVQLRYYSALNRSMYVTSGEYDGTWGSGGLDAEVLFEARALPTMVTVPDDCATIQGAINAVSPSGLVHVRSGTYHEQLTVNKPLTLEGESSDNTIIEGVFQNETLITINATDVQIYGFLLQNGRYAISTTIKTNERINVTNNRISNNRVYGIWLWMPSRCRIENNEIDGNRYGICMAASIGNPGLDNVIAGNSFSHQKVRTIEILNCQRTLIERNNITYNEGTNYNQPALLLLVSDDTEVYHNNFIGNLINVYLDPNSPSHGTIWDHGYPYGGNYWSDYSNRYPHAAEKEDSCIWNTPCAIDENNTDQNPLILPYEEFLAETTSIEVRSQYTGYFVENFPIDNIFGVRTSHLGFRPDSVYGVFRWILGPYRIISFSSPLDTGDPYWLSEPIDVGSLLPFSTLEVYACYPDGLVLPANCSLKVIPTPSWLVSILEEHAEITVEPQTQREWDNTYKINIEREFDLSGIFNITVPLPEFAGGGNYSLLPSIGFGFSFYSNGTCEIYSRGIAEGTQAVPMQFGAGSVTAHIGLNVSGVVSLVNNTITWVSASFSFDIGASASLNFPIAGYTFDVPMLGKVTIGLSATVTFDADFGVTLVLAPARNQSEELISGIGIMIQSITGKISFGAGIAINAGCGIASITGGGKIEVDVYLQATQPYVYKFTVIGTLFIKYHVLFWDGTLWSKNATLYQWPEGDLDFDPTNFTVTVRYYDTIDYGEFEWTNGTFAGTAIHNVYPQTRVSAASSGNSVYILYTDDNISMPIQSGLCVRGLKFDSSQGNLASLTLPSMSDAIFFNPVIIGLPNGSLLAMWDSIPFSEANSANGPLNISKVTPQYSCFDINTQNWSPIRDVSQSGVATSYLLSSNSSGCYALVLQGENLFSSNQSLVEYDLENGFELLRMDVTNASDIVSFDCSSQTAILQMLDGSYELLNLSSLQPITLPLEEGCQVKIVALATNSADSVGVLYSIAGTDVFSIYNISSNSIIFSMHVSQSTDSLTLSVVGSGYQLVTANSSGITSFMIENQDVEQNAFYPMENITSMDSITVENGILVYATQNYGNSSHPLINLALVFLHHDVAVTSVTSDSSWVHQGCNANVDVEVMNYGEYDENVTICLYYDIEASKMVGTQTAVVPSGENSTLVFTWNTTGIPCNQNYTMTATANINADNNLTDNTCAGGVIVIRISGDMNRDGAVDVLDMAALGISFGSKPEDVRWNIAADMNRDGIIDIFDIVIVAIHFGETG